MRIALATTRPLPEPDPDEQITLEALRAAGIEAQTLAWNEGSDLGGFDAIVLRSTWDYYLAPDAFRAWVARAAERSRLINPLRTVLSNLHKDYLLELGSRGVPIVPTTLVRKGAEIEREAFESECGLVVKPAVGASSWKASAFSPGEDAERYVHELSRDMDVLVQPYQPSVEHGGERSLVWIAGEFTHCVTKRPRFAGGEESVSGSEPLTPEDRSRGARALAAYLDWTGEPLLYARVDLIGGLVSEVELIEPSLFFLQEPAALETFVRALHAACR